MTFNALAIPAEMRELPNWICWKYEYPNGPTEKPTKVPYQISGSKASSTDPKTWVSFDAAFNAYSMGIMGFDGLGFMFSQSPFCGIDLDSPEGDQIILDRQIKIQQEFDSYSEVSPSGTGLHIIIRGSVPAGRRRSKIEIYSEGRFFTMTGNSYGDKPIADRQEMLTQLWEQMGGEATTNIVADQPQTHTDEQIIDMALGAKNGEKFAQLHRGEWQGLYPSQSEADYAYVDIIAFYSRNKQQIWRLYVQSPLGNTDKKRRRPDYIEKMINRSFDNMLPPIDFEGMHNALELKKAQTTKLPAVPVMQAKRSSIPLPPGLIGEIAQFIYSAAPRPVEEIALAGALALMSGICGRAYNISSTGLNQYVLLIAGTGVGKEAAASGISKIMNEVKLQVPAAHEFIGPSEISSGPALFKYIGSNSKSFVCLLGEFGLRLQQLSNAHANGAEVSLRRMLLDLFNKSGVTDTLYKSVYSDKDKNTPDIQSPAFSIFGESTPSRLYDVLSEDMITEGLLPRFHIIEYTGERRDLNVHHASVQPSPDMIERIGAVCAHALTMNYAQPRRVINVETSPDALKMLDEFDRFATDQINNTQKNVTKELWNRAHIKVLKLSALIAVGVNYAYPNITPDHVEWAINLVKYDIEALSNKFETGAIGTNGDELKQQNELERIIKEYYYEGVERAIKYKSTHALYDQGIIPFAYVNARLPSIAVFRKDRLGSNAAIRRCIQSLIDSGKLRELDMVEMKRIGANKQRLFILMDKTLLD